MIKWLLAALLLLPSAAWAQNQGQIVPSGAFTLGHTIRCQNSTCTVAVDGGGAAGSSKNGQGYLTELGITNTGTPFCINDALINAIGGYHQFCLGANALGGGLISYNAYGGASPLGLTINLNGVNYSFPGAGNGNVVGPASPTPVAGNVALWNGNLTLKDGGTASAVFNLTSPSNNFKQGIISTQSSTGASATTGFWANQLSFTNAGVSTNNNFDFVGAMRIDQTVSGGSSVVDNQDTLELHMDVTSTTGCGALTACNNYQPILTTGTISAPQGGTGTTPSTGKGALFGGGFFADAKSGATNLADIKGVEINWACEPGSSAAICGGLAIVPHPLNGVHGAAVDTFIDLSNTTTFGINTAISLNNAHGFAPLSTSGCVICTSANDETISTIFDFSAYFVTDAYLNTRGMRLHDDVNGGIELGPPTSNAAIPYIDFHFGNGLTQDFNVRLENNADEALTLFGATTGQIAQFGQTTIIFNKPLIFPTSTTGAVTPAFTNAPTSCTNVVWLGPFSTASPSQGNIYIAACHT